MRQAPMAPQALPPYARWRRIVAADGRALGNEAREQPMDWDDVRPEPKKGAVIGDNLDTLSVAELEARISDLEREIARVKAELEKKRRHEDAASALFKR